MYTQHYYVNFCLDYTCLVSHMSNLKVSQKGSNSFSWQLYGEQ